nr:glycosyltransferase family 4 protein [uncultured Flavobacterium sp.]
MKIMFISAFYSEGMGYSENSLPKSLASLGHEVHVITSDFNVYGNDPSYNQTYRSFLGEAKQPLGTFDSVGYKVHRLKSVDILGYVYIKGLRRKIVELSPDIVQVTEIASLNTFKLALLKSFFKFKLYTESHQHLSVVKPYVVNPKLNILKNIIYKLTRTLPSYLASLFIEKCYAIAPDCVEVANKYYGVPISKIKLQPLGTDTILFHPLLTEKDRLRREEIRSDLGLQKNDILCIYTGRFTKDKDPLVLAKAVNKLFNDGHNFFSLFIGEGIQKTEIENQNNAITLEFMRHVELADYYRASDIGVWPRQESMSMLDAASTGLPLIVTDSIGEFKRVEGNGYVYKEGDSYDLAEKLLNLLDKDLRDKMGRKGSHKMKENYSWINVATNIENDY